ncbi:MAG: nitroreductase/quinone reductase family protein [Anaerolineae bacterium]|nr:nitroreductase/quinone reductase family protein [Anaerolineae bacterium]
MGIQQQIRDRIRVFNKHFLNRLTRRFAYARRGPVALVRHVGRRSGKSYETPIFVAPAEGAFVIALTYGPEVDWHRNVLAAGGCGILWHGQEYTIHQVEPMDAEAGRRNFPQPERWILGRAGIRHFARMVYETPETDQ